MTGYRPGSLYREAMLAAGAAASLAAVLLWLGPPGNDLAAHLYQRAFFIKHGFVLWNNFWYAGRYSFVTYSVLYYPLSALLGIKVLALASIAAAALVEPHLRGRLGRNGPVRRVPVRARRGAGAASSAGFAAEAASALRAARRPDARGQPARVRPARRRAGRRRRCAAAAVASLRRRGPARRRAGRARAGWPRASGRRAARRALAASAAKPTELAAPAPRRARTGTRRTGPFRPRRPRRCGSTSAAAAIDARASTLIPRSADSG